MSDLSIFQRLLSTILGFADILFSFLSHKRTTFKNGWGNLSLPKNFDSLADNEKPLTLFTKRIPPISVTWVTDWVIEGTIMHRIGTFRSPMADRVDNVPEVVKTAFFQFVLSSSYKDSGLNAEGLPVDAAHCSVVLQTAATGDQGFTWRRTQMARPLCERHNIGSIILEIPFYGRRNPRTTKKGSALDLVSDMLFQLGGTIEESRSLLKWLETNGQWKGLRGISGISLGGAMASVTGTVVDFPIAISAHLPSHSPAPTYIDGVLKRTVCHDILQQHLEKDKDLHDIQEDVLCSKKRLYRYLSQFTLLEEEWDQSPNHKVAFVQVSAWNDWYIPFSATLRVFDFYKNAPNTKTEDSIRWLKGGHVYAFIKGRDTFIESIAQSFKMLSEINKQ